MTVNAAVLPEGVAPPPQARTHGVAISSAGVGDLASIARQQLPSAVPAPALVAAYNAAVQPQTKQPPRATAAAPSSALAAQFIAQSPTLTEEDLAIFSAPTATLPTPAEAEPPADDFLTQLRIARGDTTAAQATPGTNKPTASAKPETAARAETSPAAPPPPTAATEPGQRGGMAYIASVLPSLVQQLIPKPPVVVTSRGVIAYQMAQARKPDNRNAPAPDRL